MDKRKHSNKVCGYLKPKQDALFKGFMEVNEIGQSEAVNIIFKDFFQRLTAEEKITYLSCSKPKNTYQ
jgi:hypothetical protein